MQVAQSLYENGYITYMRTDSTTLASVAVDAARELVASQFGREYVPERPRVYQTKVKNAQEAHEAIRPAGHPFESPDALRSRLNADEFRLYDLIWKRTVASQMADARGHRVTITISADGAMFEVSGTTIEFPGYLRAYREESDEADAESSQGEAILPAVAVDEALNCRELATKSHTTKPPNRFSEAALTRTLEEKGIGRPSTYAAIIDTILAREYVFKRGNSLVPTWTAFAVCQLLEEHLPDLVNYQFTAEMEDELDSVSRGERGHVEYLRQFYFGDGHAGLKQQLANKIGEINARDVSRILIGRPEGAEPAADVYVRVGRFGPFVEHGERRASLPDKMAPDEMTLAVALELLDKAAQGDEPLGVCPQTGKPVYLKAGRFGPYVQCGRPEDEEKPQNASLLKGMRPEDVTLELALKLLSLPRVLGDHPQTGEPIVAQNGRFGPFVKCGVETRSLPEDLSPLEITAEQALELLAQPKRRGRGASRAEPIKVFEASPVSQQPVQLLAGRYGPYVTDGETNASLPRTATPQEVTFQQALDLLAARGHPALEFFGEQLQAFDRGRRAHIGKRLEIHDVIAPAVLALPVEQIPVYRGRVLAFRAELVRGHRAVDRRQRRGHRRESDAHPVVRGDQTLGLSVDLPGADVAAGVGAVGYAAARVVDGHVHHEFLGRDDRLAVALVGGGAQADLPACDGRFDARVVEILPRLGRRRLSLCERAQPCERALERILQVVAAGFGELHLDLVGLQGLVAAAHADLAEELRALQIVA